MPEKDLSQRLPRVRLLKVALPQIYNKTQRECQSPSRIVSHMVPSGCNVGIVIELMEFSIAKKAPRKHVG